MKEHDPRYDPNTRQWKVGELVIHSADAKADYMLMKVIGYARDGRCKTKYLQPHPRMSINNTKRIWLNDLCWLLDPAKFDISVPVEVSQ